MEVAQSLEVTNAGIVKKILNEILFIRMKAPLFPPIHHMLDMCIAKIQVKNSPDPQHPHIGLTSSL